MFFRFNDAKIGKENSSGEIAKGQHIVRVRSVHAKRAGTGCLSGGGSVLS
jgi:hypothetical protein